MIGKLICFFKGHKRGKLVSQVGDLRTFHCPRCGHETRYKVKQP